MSKKFIPVLITLVLLGGGLAAGMVVLNQQQVITKKASTGSGTVEVLLDPASADIAIGGSKTANVVLRTTAQKSIKGISIKFSYTSSSGSPLAVTSVTPDAALVGAGWGFPIKAFDASTARIGAIFNSGNYVLASGDTTVATVNFQGVSNGTVTVTFDPTYSLLQDASGGTGQDILLTPSSTATYIVGSGAGGATATPTTPAGGNTPTPTPTTAAGGSTGTPTPTPTTRAGATATPTRRVTATPTGRVTTTPRPTQPVSGSVTQTMGLVGAGMAAIILGGLVFLFAL